MSVIRFQCDNCGEAYQVESKHSGKTTKCSKCKFPITVPISTPGRVSRNHVDIAPTEPPLANQPTIAKPAAPNVQVTIDRDKPSGLHGFFRAFGITSGFIAAVAAVLLGIPILVCGGCLVSMIGIGATVETQPRSVSSNNETNGTTGNSLEFLSSDPAVPLSDPAVPLSELEIEFGQQAPEPIIAQTLPQVDLSGRPNVYVFDGLTATVSDQYVNDIRIVDLKGRPMTADVLLENNSGMDWKPKLRIELVNAYGVVLGTTSIIWALTAMEPTKRYTESISMYPNRFDDIFRYSSITRPSDFDEPKFLVLHY